MVPDHQEKVRLGCVLLSISRPVSVLDAETYRLLGVRWYGNGCHEHSVHQGRELKTKQLNLVQANDVVYNKMWTTKAAFAVAEQAHHGLVATSEYPTFVADLERLFPPYLRAFMTTEFFLLQARDACQGSTSRARLNPSAFLDLSVRLPPLPEQKKIAAILSSVDDTIAKTESVIAQLQIVKKAMMEQLLTKGMPGRHTRFQTLDTEWRLGRIVPDIGEIPETWRLVHITDVARLESGHTPSRNHPEYWEGDIPWVSLHDSKNLDGPVIMDTAQTIGTLGLANSSARMLPKGTVVFSRTATVGKCTVLGRDMSTSQDFANYVCGPTLDPRYLMHLMRNMQTEWKRLMAGSTHQTIYMPVFRDLQILLPPMDEQRQIAAIGDQFHGTIASENKTVAELKHLKSALSSSLLSGEIRVVAGVA